ncbi:MAG: hypothetical protein JO165_11905 [Candidatus Eremiobacteraeota bacterium]|nr:hypothetical protein [Candidatus Eremiobacteraeota bacterium]
MVVFRSGVLALILAATMGQSQISDLAPADQYFGHTHLSILELRHRTMALKDDLHKARHRPNDISHDASTLTDAFFDWSSRFPKDPWLPRTGWDLATLYEELPGPDARDSALQLLHFIADHFPSSQFAQLSQRDLARGVGVRPWPHWAGAPPKNAAAPRIAQHSTPTPARIVIAQATPDELVGALLDLKHASNGNVADTISKAQQFQDRIRSSSQSDEDGRFARAAWELATLYEVLPGDDSRESAIRMLALVVDRYAGTRYGEMALEDLKRGVGERR